MNQHRIGRRVASYPLRKNPDKLDEIIFSAGTKCVHFGVYLCENMKPSSTALRKVIVLSILLAFLANEAVSLLADPQIKSITQTAVYQFNESVQGVPFTVTEPITKVAFVLFLLQLFLPLFRVLKRKVRKLLLFAVSTRNPFYRHITIHAP